MNNSDHIPTTEELKNLEADPVWSLLNEASSQKVNPTFVDSVMTQISANIPDNVVTSPSFWKRYSLPISAAAVAGIAACLMVALSSDNIIQADVAPAEIEFSDDDYTFIEQGMPFVEEANTASEVTSEIDIYTEQMVEIDNEDPFIMTADDIDALVTM